MSSPYRAHFEVRDQTRLLVFLTCVNALAVLGWAALAQEAVVLRLIAAVVGTACLVVAWGLHGAQEWARIGGIVLGLAALVFVFVNKGNDLLFGLVFTGTAIWLALPSTKKLFASAREMIRRTEEIKQEQKTQRWRSKLRRGRAT